MPLEDSRSDLVITTLISLQIVETALFQIHLVDDIQVVVQVASHYTVIYCFENPCLRNDHEEKKVDAKT